MRLADLDLTKKINWKQIQKWRPPREIQRTARGPVVGTGTMSELLEISKTELKARVKDGIYPALLDDKGRYWFDVVVIKQLLESGDQLASGQFQSPFDGPRGVGRPAGRLARLAPVSPKAPKPEKKPVPKFSGYDGELAKLVFADLEAGKNAIAIVVERALHPEQVKACVAMYDDFKGEMRIDGAQRAQLEGLPLHGERPFASVEALITSIARTFAAACSRCGLHKPTVCGVCLTELEVAKVANG